MFGTPEDNQYPLATAPRPTFALVHAEDRIGVYKHTGKRWERTNIITTDTEEVIRDTLTAADATIRDITDGIAVLIDGEFPETLNQFTTATAITILQGEVGLLRRQAESKRLDAAFSDMRHDNGSRILDARADALEHAIAIFAKYSN